MESRSLATEPAVYLAKARQNLEAARLTLDAAQFDASASRAYYAAFHAAIAALWVEGIRPPRDLGGTRSHPKVQAEWSGRLIYRRKRYPPEFKATLQQLFESRVLADYGASHVTRRVAERAYKLSMSLVGSVEVRLQAEDSSIA